MVPQTPINNTIFWKSIMRTFRCIPVNCFNWPRILAKVCTKLKKKNALFQKIKDNNSGNMETRQMAPSFHLLSLLCLWHSFLFLKIVKIHFHVFSPFTQFWSVKHLDSRQKLLIQQCRIQQFWGVPVFQRS